MRSRVLFCGALFFIITTTLHLACKEETPPQPPPPLPYVSTVQLAIEDTGVTDVWLKLRFTDTTMPRNYQLRRDGAIVLSGTLATPDTVLLDTAALPKRTYQYKAYRLNATVPTDSSASLSVTTMDTTSHNFTWQIDTLGVTSSVLYDVAIINDTLAYAVGEMYLLDSTGQFDPILYNYAVLNGTRWTIRRLAYFFQGQPFYSPVQTVFAFGANDIWFAGNGVSRWDGQRFVEIPIPTSVWGPNRMNKIWGSSSSDIYMVGDNGSIAHYNGSMWTRIESGTTLDVYDVSGERNARTGEWEVYAVAGKLFVNSDRKILRLTPTRATAIADSGIRVPLSGIWFMPERHYYLVGGGMFDRRQLSSSTPWRSLHPNVTSVYTRGIDGTGLNDVFVVGSFGEILHFNGFTWRSFQSLIGLSNSDLRAVAVRNDRIFVVGYLPSRAIVVQGIRSR